MPPDNEQASDQPTGLLRPGHVRPEGERLQTLWLIGMALAEGFKQGQAKAEEAEAAAYAAEAAVYAACNAYNARQAYAVALAVLAESSTPVRSRRALSVVDFRHLVWMQAPSIAPE